MEEEPKLHPPYHPYTPLGNENIDKQHEELCDLLNHASELVFNKTEDTTIIRLLTAVIEKTVLHFAHEETLIRQYLNEQDAKIHIEKHFDALSTLIALKNKLELDTIKYQIRYKHDLSNFTEHLFSYDSILIDKINNKISPLNISSSGSGSYKIIEIK